MKKRAFSSDSLSKEEECLKIKESVKYLGSLLCEKRDQSMIGPEPNLHCNKNEENIEFWGCVPE